jgi:drug/metabolite transporter (DMT)-like permease
VKFFERDGTLWSGASAGVIFGIEFVLIYRGLQLTSASRAVVFLYTAPFFVALGSYVFLGERLRAPQWGGLALSFRRRRAGDRRPPGPMSTPKSCWATS